MNTKPKLQDQPQSIEEMNQVLIDAYHAAMAEQDQVYNRATAEMAIRCSSELVIKYLHSLDDVRLIEAVRNIAASAIATDPKPEGEGE